MTDASAMGLRCLNTAPPDPSRLRILILGTPKTGNTWLRWLMHYAYGVPIINLPPVWSAAAAAALPATFVSHQHYPPSAGLLQWLVSERILVLTTIRHPGDAFLSLFHYVKWRHDAADEQVVRLLDDGPCPGRFALQYLRVPYPQASSLSLVWYQLGAHTVRYEDMRADPGAVMRGLREHIAPLDEARLRAATLLCKGSLLTAPGMLDARHIRSTGPHGWTSALPLEHRRVMQAVAPYTTIARTFGYDWNADASCAPDYDYDTIDPFGGAGTFDNHESVAPVLVRIYLLYTPAGAQRWPDPRLTAGDSYWNWLQAPCTAALRVGQDPATLTNLMWAVHAIRTDLQQAYPDPALTDRLAYARWFIGQAHVELGLPWALIEPCSQAYCRMLVDGVNADVG